MRILLINPKFPESFWSFKWAINEVLPGLRATCPPLGLATLAALCPADWEVRIVDENIESVPLAPEADIVGVCGMGVQLPRQKELLNYFRERGYYTVAGGSYSSLVPEQYSALADTVVAGEAEYIWKAFCADFTAGTPKKLYHETGTVALADSPVPSFELLQLARYSNATLQYSRGCPFRCEFCDIIVMFGRKPRVKALDQIGRELDALRRAGMHRVFFVDDNLIGNKPQAKLLLKFLKEYQEKHDYRFSFGTEASLNLAQDKELLALFRAANFGWVFIGIESTDPASLKETLKTQNLAEDILTSVRRIYSYGIDVLGGFIIGFDNDTLDTFEQQYRFITESGIQSAMIGLLMALPRTPLYERLQKDGRLIELDEVADNTRPRTNVVPMNMSAAVMALQYMALYRRLLSDKGIADRIRNKVRYLRAPGYDGGYTMADRLRILGRLLLRGILPGGPSRLYHFLGTFPVLRPARIPLVISDWIIGLSMREFARQNLSDEPSEPAVLEHRFALVRASMESDLARGSVAVTLRGAGTPDLVISLRETLDRGFFVRAAPRLEQFLKTTRARITLRVDGLRVPQIDDLGRLLRPLARYGDRVFIVLDEQLRGLVPIDSSVFNVVLAQPANRLESH